MDQQNKFVALMAMRAFVRGLSPEQAYLFHQIAARYQNNPQEYWR